MHFDNNKSIIKALEARDLTKSMQTLLGICSGITADNNINDHEVHFLNAWIKDNPSVVNVWPGSVIAERLHTILHDGIITQEERADLLGTLKQITGNDFTETGAAEPELIQIDYDDADVQFINRNFCMTGKFLHGTRTSCTKLTEKLGGIIAGNISRKLDYLVIGALISPDWIYQSYGRKIEAAMQLKSDNHPIAIISEEQWEEAIKNHIKHS